MMQCNIISFFLVFSLAYSSAEVPADIQKCKAEDGACIANTINEILQKNPKGREDIGLPDIDPYKVKKVVISDSKGSSSLSLDLTFFDVDFFGLKNSKVDRAVGFGQDAATTKFEIYGVMPKMELHSKYKTSGRILILPIEGEGDAKIILTNMKASIKFKPTISTRDGKTFFTDNKVKVLLEPERMQIRMENLFNGNKELGENMNTFLNENWKDVWDELAPNINLAMADVLKNILNNVFKKLSYDDFYL